uniref:Uncharacterized protein n=1 Tax=Oryza sativa subsp. japonica TaxID=39947 RepID=Q6ZGC6_ORYSJ|nr:hypothetical protein [Oryza sativa Japonica Group]
MVDFYKEMENAIIRGCLNEPEEAVMPPPSSAFSVAAVVAAAVSLAPGRSRALAGTLPDCPVLTWKKKKLKGKDGSKKGNRGMPIAGYVIVIDLALTDQPMGPRDFSPTPRKRRLCPPGPTRPTPP